MILFRGRSGSSRYVGLMALYALDRDRKYYVTTSHSCMCTYLTVTSFCSLSSNHPFHYLVMTAANETARRRARNARAERRAIEQDFFGDP